ncbi:Integral membrane protein TerC family protein [compost metagenome]
MAVEGMDIAFSIDSVIAAFGVSKQVWVLYIGGILGILMMRSIAQLFIKLIQKFPALEKTAFIIILIISIKMFAGVFGIHTPQSVFFFVLFGLFFGTIVLSMIRSKSATSVDKS